MDYESMKNQETPGQVENPVSVVPTDTGNSRARIKIYSRQALEFIIYIFQVLIISLIIINFIGRVSVVQGSSMVPSLHTNNRIVVNLLAYKFSQPERGDIIIFQCPVNPEKDYIKRVIGLSGETLEIKEGMVYINEQLLDEYYLDYSDGRENIEAITIPDDSIYVMGDNRLNSEDSRFWGPLEKKLIKGKAQLIFWPPEKFFILK
ncbi:MAG: signal peptidase I [Vulcanimicrobiota bacterium]